jgi:hypothetical protein
MKKKAATHSLILAPLVIGLSIVVPWVNVNAQGKNDFARLGQFLLDHGNDGSIGSNFARVIGLPSQAASKNVMTASKNVGSDDKETHLLDLIVDTTTVSGSSKPAPICFYFGLRQVSSKEIETHVYRADLDGNLVMAIESHGEVIDGKAVRGTGKKVDRDISSAAVKKAFQAEVALAFKWLKKQRREHPSSK